MLFPITYRVNSRGHMEVGGCDLVDLAGKHGTPLYVYDEDTVRQRAAEYVSAMGGAGEVLYSAKAFASPAFLRIVADEGLGLDVVSAGELHLALKSGFPGRADLLPRQQQVGRRARARGTVRLHDRDRRLL